MTDVIRDLGPDALQDGLVPPLEKEAAGVISGTDTILKAYASNLYQTPA